jgi:hypothetical protein
MSGAGFTRRAFVARAAAIGAAVGALPALGVAREVASATDDALAAPMPHASALRATPVLSFHLDQPYLDYSGEGIPYVPPSGARGAEALSTLSEADLFCCLQRY